MGKVLHNKQVGEMFSFQGKENLIKEIM